MTRAVKEWIGKTDDTPAPPRVRLRVFERYKGICHISGALIRAGQKWELEHKVALCNGGENRESNFAPALVKPHKEKTARDVAEKKVTVRKRKKNLGIHARKSRPMPGTIASGWKKPFGGGPAVRR